MSRCGQRREAEVGYPHQDQRNQDRALESQLGKSHPANEDPDQIGPEAHPDIVKCDFIVAETHVVEQQPEGEIRERVADLVEQDEQQHQHGALPLKELHKGPGNRLERLQQAFARDSRALRRHHR